ncbi:MAG: DUF4124 domain-containing protein [Betaproteobacteria bacterium]|nr:MAG: DUF4124 domain-containing protein [Betaproteobacteria bacterium]
MASSWQPGRALMSIPWNAAGFAALVALVAAPAAAQILKCTDGSGNVTYQNEPCPKNVKAGHVDIFDNSWTADRAEREAEWRRNAALHRVVTGMPLRLVRDALGEPAEVRDTATAGDSRRSGSLVSRDADRGFASARLTGAGTARARSRRRRGIADSARSRSCRAIARDAGNAASRPRYLDIAFGDRKPESGRSSPRGHPGPGLQAGACRAR